MATSRPQNSTSELHFRGVWGDKGSRISRTYGIYRKFDPHRPYHRLLLIKIVLGRAVGNTPTAREKISQSGGRELAFSWPKFIRRRSVFTGQEQSRHRAVRLRNYQNCSPITFTGS